MSEGEKGDVRITNRESLVTESRITNDAPARRVADDARSREGSRRRERGKRVRFTTFVVKPSSTLRKSRVILKSRESQDTDRITNHESPNQGPFLIASQLLSHSITLITITTNLTVPTPAPPFHPPTIARQVFIRPTNRLGSSCA